MSSTPAQPNLVLTRRPADGTIEWIPLEIPQRLPATAGADYALIDRSNYEAPQTLMARRQGLDLIVEVNETDVLVLAGFFATRDVTFYPTTDIAGGAGPFSGSPITPDAPVLAGSPEGTQVVWSAEQAVDDGPGNGSTQSDGGARPGDERPGGASPVLWGGLGVAGLGLAAAAGGGGGGSSGDSSSSSGGAGETLDTSAPRITSGTTAAAIDENGGPGQVIYTATATDAGTVTWSLGGNAAAFSINASTGAVTLIGDPNFEAQSSYGFTVVATDTAGNSSQQSVSLAINDLDEVAPMVTSVALTSAIGARNDTLNAGDSVTVTVTMSENTVVDTAGGTPRIALTIGGSTAYAVYASGSGSTSVTFDYTVQPGDTDSNGMSIEADALELNGGSLTDAAGNSADLSHGPVSSNASYAVDTTDPSLSSSTPADNATAVPVGDELVLTFSEDVQTGSGTITIRDASDTRTIDITDGSQISISGNRVTIDPASDLNGGSTYNVQIGRGALRDEAGNAYAGISDSTTLNFDTETVTDTGIVVFDLVQGSSSDHSDRTFQSGVSYDIYIRVDSNDAGLRFGARERWEGAANLGSDDRIILVGDGAPIEGPAGLVNQVSVDATAVAWSTRFGSDAGVVQGRSFTRTTGFGRRDNDDARLFDTALPSAFLGNQGGQTSTMYFINMPAGILTSQGLV